MADAATRPSSTASSTVRGARQPRSRRTAAGRLERFQQLAGRGSAAGEHQPGHALDQDRLLGHVGGDVVGAGQRGGGPGGHAEVVGQALLGQRDAGGERDVGRQPRRVPLVERDAQTRDEVRAAAPPDRLERLAQEAEAVPGGAAVLVVAEVDGRVEELRREVAVAGDDLDAVRRHHDMAGVSGGLVDPGHLDHDQAGAAARAGPVVGDERSEIRPWSAIARHALEDRRSTSTRATWWSCWRWRRAGRAVPLV